MTTFVLVIFFWEAARGYAVTNVPGYESRAACEAAASELRSVERNSYANIRALCVPGPKSGTAP